MASLGRQISNRACPAPLDFGFLSPGSISGDLAAKVHETWLEEAVNRKIDLEGFNPAEALNERVNWARSKGLAIGGGLARFSSNLQKSTSDQCLDIIRYAAAHNFYLPPEHLCADEGVSGRKLGRHGLERMKSLLHQKHVEVLLVFKISRLFRLAYRGYEFFQEELVEEGLRGISITQGIDTKDEKTWKLMCYMHGIMDEMLLAAIADHVRSSVSNLFRAGYVTGALPVGYYGKEVPGAPPTNKGTPRRMPAVVTDVAALIRQHYEWVRDGMKIFEGRRRWIQADGPVDPRSQSKQMSYTSYRSMLSNERYTGRWAFGKKRNSWSSKRDCMLQLIQPESEIVVAQCDDLRIVPDELFHDVQRRLASLTTGSRGPKKQRDRKLCDMVADCFACDSCDTEGSPAPYYHGGANGKSMHCKHGLLCSSHTFVNRDAATKSVCKKLTELLQKDSELVEQVVTSAERISQDNDTAEQLANLENRVAGLSRKINDLVELAGDGTDEDRAQMRSKARGAMNERATLQSELARRRTALRNASEPITEDQVRGLLQNFTKLLDDAAAGRLGDDLTFRAAAVFRHLVGGKIRVVVERRAGRKSTNVRGVFVPRLFETLQTQLAVYESSASQPPTEISVWLRPPPRIDQLAERVHQLIDVEGQSFRTAEKTLRMDGFTGNSGTVWQIYRRYYQMIGQPMPPLAYNNGHLREHQRR